MDSVLRSARGRLTFTVSGVEMDRKTDYMGIYRNISTKLKKRFLKKPNLSEGSDEFGSLSKTFTQQESPAYAAFCLLAQARCEHALGNGPGEIHSLLSAARAFIVAEKQTSDVLCPSYHENLTAAINCYEHAIKVALQHRESPLAASYCKELATTLLDFNKPGEARIHFQRAAELQLQNPVECLQTMEKVAHCKIKERDLEGALTILTEMQFLAQDRGGVAGSSLPLGVYSSVLLHCEITRVLLLMLLQPTSQRIRPEHAQALERYAWQHSPDDSNIIVDIMDADLFLMLQSLVMSCQSHDAEAICNLQSDLWAKFSPMQNELMQQIVVHYSNR